MFEIEYKGANCVVISTKKSKLVVDPKISLVGLKDISTKDAVEIATEERFDTKNPEAMLSIESPGEYGIAGFDIRGVAARRHLDDDKSPLISTMYRIEIDDIRIGVIGNIFEKLSEDQLESLGVIDILIIPVGGGGYTLDSVGAASVVRAVNPKVVIPVHYFDDLIKYEVPQAELKDFISELGVPVETMPKYTSKQFLSVPETLSIVEVTRS